MATLVFNYNFKVSLGSIEMGFQKVSGIGRNIEVCTIKEGGLNGMVHVFPDRVNQAGVLHLESGVVLEAYSPLLHIGTSIDTMRIDVLNQARKSVRVYHLKHLVITKWELSDFTAAQSEILIDRFDLAYGEVYVGF